MTSSGWRWIALVVALVAAALLLVVVGHSPAPTWQKVISAEQRCGAAVAGWPYKATVDGVRSSCQLAGDLAQQRAASVSGPEEVCLKALALESHGEARYAAEVVYGGPDNALLNQEVADATRECDGVEPHP